MEIIRKLTSFPHAPAMVSEQEIASCVKSVLRGSAGGPREVSLVVVLQQAEATLGVDLSHKVGFIRDQLDLFFGPRLQPPPLTMPQPAPVGVLGPTAHPGLPLKVFLGVGRCRRL
jgi:upstream activation factor subunit UAF30